MNGTRLRALGFVRILDQLLEKTSLSTHEVIQVHGSPVGRQERRKGTCLRPRDIGT